VHKVESQGVSHTKSKRKKCDNPGFLSRKPKTRSRVKMEIDGDRTRKKKGVNKGIEISGLRMALMVIGSRKKKG